MWRPPAHRNTLEDFIIKSNSKAICIQFNVKMVNHSPNTFGNHCGTKNKIDEWTGGALPTEILMWRPPAH